MPKCTCVLNTAAHKCTLLRQTVRSCSRGQQCDSQHKPLSHVCLHRQPVAALFVSRNVQLRNSRLTPRTVQCRQYDNYITACLRLRSKFSWWVWRLQPEGSIRTLPSDGAEGSNCAEDPEGAFVASDWCVRACVRTCSYIVQPVQILFLCVWVAGKYPRFSAKYSRRSL